MYFAMVIGLMVVLPLISVVAEFAVSGGGANALLLAGKWFLFWGVGVRLFIAGLSQTVRPGFTVENILGNKDAGAAQIVKELGFANLGMGMLGIVAPWIAGWSVPAAITPAIFLGLAGIVHIVKKNKNSKEWVATVTDLFVAIVLAIFVIVSLASGV